MAKEKLRNILAAGILTAGLFTGCRSETVSDEDVKFATLLFTASMLSGIGSPPTSFTETRDSQAIDRDTESTLIMRARDQYWDTWSSLSDSDSEAEQLRENKEVDKKYRELMGMNDEEMIRREIALFADSSLYGNGDHSTSPIEENIAYSKFQIRWMYEEYTRLRDRPFVKVIESWKRR